MFMLVDYHPSLLNVSREPNKNLGEQVVWVIIPHVSSQTIVTDEQY